MAQDKENFLGRWSRLKREHEQEEKTLPEKNESEDGPPELPPLDKLTPQSEFSGFMHPKVGDALRRAALKKLFSDPHFNIPDPYEAYSGDWTVGEAIPDEMMATLNQARTLLFSEEEKKKRDEEEKKLAEEQEAKKPAEMQQEAKKLAEGKPKDDEPGRQDT
jgi:Protein of unknown function (DUF3306)